jgi:hypothetical protein
MAFRSSFGLLRGKYYSLSVTSRSVQMRDATLSYVIQKDHTAR